MKVHIYDDIDEIPKEGECTVVTEAEENSSTLGAILVKDCVDGVIDEESESYHDTTDLDDSVLKQNNLEDVWVERDAQHAFTSIIEFAQTYQECDGDLEKVCEALDEKLDNELKEKFGEDFFDDDDDECKYYAVSM